MVTSLKGLSAQKHEFETKCTLLSQQAKVSNAQIAVLRQEVETATDFLLDQEQRLREAGGMALVSPEG